MATFSETLAGRIGSAVCSYLGNFPTLPRIYNRLLPGLIRPVPGTNDIVYTVPPFLDYVEYVYRTFCNREPPPRPDPPFTGGQCECLRYDVQAVINVWSSTGGCTAVPLNTSKPEVWGPITRVFWGSDPNNPIFKGVFVECRGRTNEPCKPEPVLVNMGAYGGTSGCPDPFVSNVTITPKGHADDCGDTPFIPIIIDNSQTFNNFTLNNFNYTDNSQNNVNLGDVNLTLLAPRIGINGRLNIPFRIAFNPNVNLNGSIDADGRVDISPPGRRGTDGGDNPEDIEPVTDPPDTPNTAPPEDLPVDKPAKEVDVIVGVLVVATIQNPLKVSSIEQNENPDIYIPSLGHVNFRIRINSRRTAWSSDIPIKNTNTVIPCPWRYGAVDVKATGQPGIQLSLTPLKEKRNVDEIPTDFTE